MSKNVQIIGLNAFTKSVARKPKAVQQAVYQELSHATLRVERRAKQIAPWDTGWLCNSIYEGMVSLEKGEVVSPVEYSIWIENGTRYMMAQPFLGPALKADYPILMRNLNKLMGG